MLRNGIKDCSNCIIPHGEEGYDYILEVVKNRVYCK
jgi:Zn-finger protein